MTGECVCYCHGDYDQSADLCDHCRPPDYGAVVRALQGMLLCFDSLSDADLSALGLKRSSACVVDARMALAAAEFNRGGMRLPPATGLHRDEPKTDNA